MTIPLVSVLVFAAMAPSQNASVGWSVFDAGFSASTGTNVEMKSVVGQTLTGSAAQSNSVILTGFLANGLFGTLDDVDESAHALPREYALRQNYPNPFNPTTTISFDLPKASDVSLIVFNVLGQQRAVLVNEKREPGTHLVTFDASGLPSGVYFYRIVAGEFVSSKKLLLVK